MSNLEILDKLYMQEALKQAQVAYKADEVPVGAVITFQNKIIAKSHNQVELLKDPTAHAEMIAITQASNSLESKWLLDCTLYVTLEPCSMCAGALVLSRIKRVVYGAKDLKTGACGSVVNLARHTKLNHQFELSEGFLADECGGLLSDFFKSKRESAKIRLDKNRLMN